MSVSREGLAITHIWRKVGPLSRGVPSTNYYLTIAGGGREISGGNSQNSRSRTCGGNDRTFEACSASRLRKLVAQGIRVDGQFEVTEISLAA